jgi:putative inorganic carbon (hco3(-)) transporter
MSEAAGINESLLFAPANTVRAVQNQNSCRWGFVSFIAATALLYIRPADFVVGLDGIPLYSMLLLVTVALSLPALERVFRIETIIRSPISACVAGLLFAAIFSQLANLREWEARNAGFLFGYILLYYALLIGLVTQPRRLEQLLSWTAIFTGAGAVVALLAYHGAISVPALRPLVQDSADNTGPPVVRLRGSGIFNDPNDFCLALSSAIFICLWRIRNATSRLRSVAWVITGAILIYAVAATRSRGGLIALGAGIMVLAVRGGKWRRSVPLLALIIAAGLVLMPSRQTDIQVATDTGQSRVKIWSDGLELFQQSPIWGIGFDEFADQVGLVAHNSFLHCFVELGMIGGMFFLGAFVQSVWGLERLRNIGMTVNPRLHRLRPYLLAMTVSSIVGMLSLSRQYVVPTYMLLGCVATFQLMATANKPGPLRFNAGFVHRTVVGSVIFIVGIYLFVQINAHWR